MVKDGINMSPGVCLDCGERLRGRSDKKFCSDQCRNNYNNRVNREQNSYVRNIHNLLRRNRRILADLYENGHLKVHRDALIVAGFSFGFFTQMVEPADGAWCWYCYEYGISELDDDYLKVLLNPHMPGEF
jgi:predicted nucleic acid-binding Zn ribbon protein